MKIAQCTSDLAGAAIHGVPRSPPMTLSDIDELLDEEVLSRPRDLEVPGSEQRPRDNAT